LSEKDCKADERAIKKFYDEYLCRDGVTILRLMHINTENTAVDCIYDLWGDYNYALKHEQKQKQWWKKSFKPKPNIPLPLTIGQFDNNGQIRSAMCR